MSPPTERALLIVLASDDTALRRRWRDRLGDLNVREVRDRLALTGALAEDQPSVVLLDVSLPGIRNVNALAGFLRRSPSSRIIIFTSRWNDAEAIAAFAAGARGYALRDLDPALVRKAVEMVQKGEIWAGRQLVARLVDELNLHGQRGSSAPDPGTELAGLTRRQREIAALVATGAANKEIAGQLRVTERTVKAHLTAIFRKLGISDRLRLALLVSGAAPDAARGLNGAHSRHGMRSASDLRRYAVAR